MNRTILRLSALTAILLARAAWGGDSLDGDLAALLRRAGFTGRIESTLTARLGRPVDTRLADLGRLLWFDKLTGLHSDNTCAGCHVPINGFGDTQSIAIGIQNNNVAGPHRAGPRNQRRTPMVINAAFYPALMWNGRFNAPSGDPFDNSKGFLFPPPEGVTRFPPFDPAHPHLLMAQGEMPPTELTEAAGYTGTRGAIDPLFDQFDDGKGSAVPPPDSSGYRNDPIRQAVLDRLNHSVAYRRLFGLSFPQVAAGGAIDFTMFGRAIAEFELTLVFADAPLDRFARGQTGAMTESQKRGAIVFFGRARCDGCHAVAGNANEMFSDFQNHVIGAPQIAPLFGAGKGNVIFDGPGQDEDYGAEQISGDAADRYKFRTAPLRNLALQPAFFHNGSYMRLDDAVRYHLDARKAAPGYIAAAAGVAADLTHRLGPIEPVLERLDPLLAQPVDLSREDFADLVEFLRTGLLDERASAGNLCSMIPRSVPSGMPMISFEGCHAADRHPR